MDTLTHALSGALVARAVAPGRRRDVPVADVVALGFLAAAFPDSDVVLSSLSPLAYLYHHRGVTHSVLLLPLWSFLVAWIWSRLRRRPQLLGVYFAVASLGIGTHILGDVITAFGTMIFAPFSDHRVAWSTTFIIDLWFTGIILAGLAGSLAWRRSRVPAVLGVAVLCGYVGLQGIAQQRAVAFGLAHARESGLSGARVSAVPRPVSPFNWMVVIEEPARYRYAFVNLLRERAREAGPDDGFLARLDAPYLPLAQARWEVAYKLGESEDQRRVAAEAFGQDRFAFFRWFAAYPVLERMDTGNPSTCVWFRDLRFLTPGRPTWPFRYGMCRHEGGPWEPFQHSDDHAHPRL